MSCVQACLANKSLKHLSIGHDHLLILHVPTRSSFVQTSPALFQVSRPLDPWSIKSWGPVVFQSVHTVDSREPWEPKLLFSWYIHNSCPCEKNIEDILVRSFRCKKNDAWILMRFYQSVKSPMRRIINHLTQTNNTGSVKIENPFLLMCAQTILVRWGNPVSEEPMIHIIEWLAIHPMSPNIPVVHEVSITWLKTNHCWGWKWPSSHLRYFYH